MIAIDECTEAEIAISGSTVALIPVGTIEGHGDYLPQGCDTFIAHELARRVAAETPECILLPPINYGMSEHYAGTGFPISLAPETLANVLVDICNNLIAGGVNRILVVNGHDGNIASIELAARKIRKSHGVTIGALEAWWWCLDEIAQSDPLLLEPDGHAGAREVSMTLVARPELVRMDRAKKPTIAEDPTYFNPLSGVRVYASYADYHLPGQYADPTSASVESGHRILEVVTDHLVEFIRHANDVDWKFGAGNRPQGQRQ